MPSAPLCVETQGARGRVRRRERRVQRHRRVRVDDPHAVGADHADTGRTDLGDELGLERLPSAPHSPKPALMTTSAFTPFAMQSSTTASTCAAARR